MSGLEALDAAMAEPEPSSIAAGTRLRKRFAADEVAWALTQVELRRRAAVKFERADEMLFTRDGWEQATRQRVARWRAQRFAEAGVRRVWDLGCGIGSDAMAFVEAGLDVVALDADAPTVEVATHNLSLVGGPPARLGRAEDVEIPAGDAVFLDPARRTAKGRTWRVEGFTPPWSLVEEYLASERFVVVKLGPGVPKEILPGDVERVWVSDGGDVVEASLWNRGVAGPVAVRLDGGAHQLVRGAYPLDVRELGAFVAEPDGAAIRAGLIAEAVAGHDAWLLDAHTAYLSSDAPIDSVWVTNFEVLDVLRLDRRDLRAYVREHGIGTLEIKKRGVDVDPAELRRSLKPRGDGSATVILARTLAGARAIVCRRVA